MELRPTYKRTEIGVIPEDWEARVLPGICWFQEGPGLRNWQFKKSGMKVINVTNLEGGILNLGRTERYISFEEFNQSYEHFAVDVDDIVMASSGNSYSKTAVVRAQDLPLVMNTSVIRFKPSNGCEHGFLWAVLNSPHFKQQIDLMITGGAQPNFGPYHLKKIWVPCPPIPEQKAIAEALSDIDASIAALSRLIAKKRELRHGVMQRLLTGQTRLPGFTAPWQEKRLGDHVVFLNNGTQSRAQLTVDDPIRYLHYGDIHVSGDLCLDLRNTLMPRLPSSAAAGLTRLQDGDVVFVDASEDLNGVGKSLEIVNANGIEAVSGQHTIAARFDKSVLADGYKCYLQFLPSFTAHLRRLAAGTKVYATNRKHIASAEFLLPDPDEQIAITRVLSDMEAEISILEPRLEKTRSLKQAMMQALLTGRVRLPVRHDAASQTKEAAHA